MSTAKKGCDWTIWEKGQICWKQEKPEHANHTLIDFALKSLDDQRIPVALFTLHDILKDKEKWLNYDAMEARWKKNNSASLNIYPMLERYPREWIDHAIEKHVAVNEFVINEAAGSITVELSRYPNYSEDYTDYSSEYLSIY